MRECVSMMRLWNIRLLFWLLTKAHLHATGQPADPTVLTVSCGPSEKWFTLNGLCLMLGDVSKNWTEARDLCRGQNSDLASLPASVPAQNLLSKLSLVSPYWVGYQSGSDQSGWLDGSPDTGGRFPVNSSDHCGSVAVAGNGTHSFLDWTLRQCNLPYLYLCMIVDYITANSTVSTTGTTAVRSSSVTSTPLALTSTVPTPSALTSTSDLTLTPFDLTSTSSTTSTTEAAELTSEGEGTEPTKILPTTSSSDDVTSEDETTEMTSVVPFIDLEDLDDVSTYSPYDDATDPDGADTSTSSATCPAISLDCLDMVLDPGLPLDYKIQLLSFGVSRWNGGGHFTTTSGPFRRGYSTTPSIQNTTVDENEEDDWRKRIQYYFWILNRYLKRTHQGRQNRSLEEVLFSLDTFLGDTVRLMKLNDALKGNYSYLEYELLSTPRSELPRYRYRDRRADCNISWVDFATARRDAEEHAKAVLVSVLMHIPDRRVFMQDGTLQEEGVISSPVLLFSGFVRGRRRNMRHSFRLRQQFRNVSTNETLQPHCVYLDTNSGLWSTFGCEVAGDGEDGAMECRCNHTSNFAVLMQIVPFKLSEVHRVALSIITYIGCSITLITQVMAITVFTCVGSLNCERVCVHRNLCIAIVGAQVTFLAGIEAVEDRLVCAVVAVLLHYCYTAVFIWMLVEGLHLYSKVVRVFGTEKSRMLYYVCFGWGVPFILVTISAAIDWEGYGTPTSCWLSTKRNTIWAFVGPALAIIIVNLVILAAVVRIVTASAKLDKHGEFDHIRAGIKAAFLLLPLLGLTWVFGLAAVNRDLIIFQYLFAFFNTLQGFFIFLFHCAFNSEVRQALKRLQERRSLQRGDLSSLAGLTSSPSVSPVPSYQDQKKPFGRGDSTSDLSSAYRVNRVVPAGYTTTTTIASNTVTLPNNHTRDRPNSGDSLTQTQMSLMFI